MRTQSWKDGDKLTACLGPHACPIYVRILFNNDMGERCDDGLYLWLVQLKVVEASFS